MYSMRPICYHFDQNSWCTEIFSLSGHESMSVMSSGLLSVTCRKMVAWVGTTVNLQNFVAINFRHAMICTISAAILITLWLVQLKTAWSENCAILCALAILEQPYFNTLKFHQRYKFRRLALLPDMAEIKLPSKFCGFTVTRSYNLAGIGVNCLTVPMVWMRVAYNQLSPWKSAGNFSEICTQFRGPKQMILRWNQRLFITIFLVLLLINEGFCGNFCSEFQKFAVMTKSGFHWPRMYMWTLPIDDHHHHRLLP